MDQTISLLISKLKKLFFQLKPKSSLLSLIIITGITKQGVSTLLSQSGYNCFLQNNNGADIYYNDHGVIIDLSASKLNKNSIQNFIKRINNCNRHIKISGLMQCIDISQLINSNSQEIKDAISLNTNLTKKFADSLSSTINLAFLFTKLDLLAGFCDFFQNDHSLDLANPFGFSIDEHTLSNINLKFDHFIESATQQVIKKIHPVRSSIKRTLIREFPLQLSSLRAPIIQIIKNVPSTKFHLKAIYFTSGEQGGVCIDRLNKKIQEEYSLILKSQIHNATNYRSYFISGAFNEFQSQSKQIKENIKFNHKLAIGALSSAAIISIILIANQYYKSANLIDKASQDLITYDSIGPDKQNKDIKAYYLAKASQTINSLSKSSLKISNIKILKDSIDNSANKQITDSFIPQLLAEIEQEINQSGQSPVEKYQALKVYLMLGNKQYQNQQEIAAWFTKHFTKNGIDANSKKKLMLLNKILQNNNANIQINQQIVTDGRNYLNALPTSYLFYSLAKEKFSKDSKPLEFDGFVISSEKIPFYLTKTGFQQTTQSLPEIIKEFTNENWVLNRPDLYELENLLKQAYSYEYVIWWQNFIEKSHPIHAQTYQDAYTLTKLLRETNLLRKLIKIIQTETGPISSPDLQQSLFNQEIASKFSDINLVSNSSIESLLNNISELERFLETMSILNDQGKAAFNLTRARFKGDSIANPISVLYSQSEQLPKPISIWAKQIADDIWMTLIQESRAYINKRWQEEIYHEYQDKIANRFPLNESESDEINIRDFNKFFAKHGTLNAFSEEYIKPFLDTSNPNWQPKEVNTFILPISQETIKELIRANVITSMFFTNNSDQCSIAFSMQNINLDPIVSNMEITIGDIKISSHQDEESNATEFTWPETNARLTINSIEGQHFEIEELGSWAFFKILKKVNVLVDEEDSSNLQIAFEINGNSGKYLLKADNQVNPFIPGILDAFKLPDLIV